MTVALHCCCKHVDAGYYPMAHLLHSVFTQIKINIPRASCMFLLIDNRTYTATFTMYCCIKNKSPEADMYNL